MATKKRGLGKGLNELLSSAFDTDVVEAEAPIEPKLDVAVETPVARSKPSENEVRYLGVETILKSQYQPRKEFDPDSLEELANSIRSQGVIQPIVVRRTATDNRFELVAGERRWRASQLAGLDKVPAIIRNFSDESALAIGLIENIQRENLNAIDEARAVKRLVDEFELTHQEAADALGKSRASVSNLLRLLSLNNDVILLLEHGDIEMGHARALLSLTGTTQSEVARTVVDKGLSVRDTEVLCSRVKEHKAGSAEKTEIIDPNVARLQNDLADKLGAKVTIKSRTNGKGHLIISYNSLDELDGILAHIN